MDYKKRFQRVLLLWYMEDDNFGDVLIYNTVSEYLKENGFEVESHEVGDNYRHIFEHANKLDFLLFAGGGIIERYIPEVIRNFKKHYKMLDVPYGIMGFGMGNFDYSEYKEELSFWVSRSEFFYVRDKTTKEKLNQISNSNKVIYSADCVFGNKYIRQIQRRYEKGHGVNIRDIPYKDLTGDFDWKQINFILERLKCDIIIPDCSKDMNNLHIKFKNQICMEGIEKKSKEQKVENTLKQIEKCEWIIAMRYHVVLVAAMIGIVSIPIMYCPKVSYLVEQLGIKELAIEIDECQRIPEKIDFLMKNYDLYVDNVSKNIQKMEKRADDMFKEVLIFLEGGNKKW